MADAGFFRGTSAQQDNRFSDKEKKMMKQMRFSENLVKKVDMPRVKLDVIKPWITQRVTQMLGVEDDVVVEFVFNQLEEKDIDPRKMQINLTGFLNGKNARVFMQELWDLLCSASANPNGIPDSFIKQKKEEIRRRGEEQARLELDIRRQVEAERDRVERQLSAARPRRRSRSRSRDREEAARRTRWRSRSRSPAGQSPAGQPTAASDAAAHRCDAGIGGDIGQSVAAQRVTQTDSLPAQAELAMEAAPTALEIRKRENTVQKKRNYRTNRDSSEEYVDKRVASYSRRSRSRSGSGSRPREQRRSRSRDRRSGSRSRERRRTRSRSGSRDERRSAEWPSRRRARSPAAGSSRTRRSPRRHSASRRRDDSTGRQRQEVPPVATAARYRHDPTRYDAASTHVGQRTDSTRRKRKSSTSRHESDLDGRKKKKKHGKKRKKEKKSKRSSSESHDTEGVGGKEQDAGENGLRLETKTAHGAGRDQRGTAGDCAGLARDARTVVRDSADGGPRDATANGNQPQCADSRHEPRTRSDGNEHMQSCDERPGGDEDEHADRERHPVDGEDERVASSGNERAASSGNERAASSDDERAASSEDERAAVSGDERAESSSSGDEQDLEVLERKLRKRALRSMLRRRQTSAVACTARAASSGSN